MLFWKRFIVHFIRPFFESFIDPAVNLIPGICQRARDAMKQRDKSETADAGERRSLWLLPIENCINIVVTVLVEATGAIVDHREDHVAHNNRQAPPEISQAKWYAGNE